MNSRSLSQLVIIGFVVAGLTVIGLRNHYRTTARRALEDSLWRLTYDVSFKCDSGEAVVRLALPTDNNLLSIEEEKFVEPSLKPGSVRTLRVSRTREFVATARHLGDFRVTAEMLLRLRKDQRSPERELVSLSADARALYTANKPELFPTQLSSVQDLLRRAEGKWEVEEELVQWVFDYCATDLRAADPALVDDSVIGALRQGMAPSLGRARTMVTLCRAAGIPARMVSGFELRQSAQLRPHVWLEVFRENHWAPFDPANGYARSMPSNFVPVRRGGEEIVLSRVGAKAASVVDAYTVSRLGPSSAALRAGAKSPWQVFDLTRLPVEMHDVIALLLLLPFGALIVSLFRNVIGIRTFGTFAPSLFAVSFIYADWVSGVMVLLVVVGAGFLGRTLIQRLRLLMVPRLGIILTTIILCVVLGVSIIDYLFPAPSANAVLLPLVILTILIERFYVTVEEDGGAYAMKLVLGTIFVSICCYLLLSWKDVGRFILFYPETHLLTIAAFVAIGRYTGYRMSELWRFRDLVKAQPPKA